MTLALKIPNKLKLHQGDKGEDVQFLQEYLERFGYIQTEKQNFANFGIEIDKGKAIEQPTFEEFDNRTEQALRLFQEFNGLPKTGDLNKETVILMQRPRCGIPDPIAGGEEFVAVGRKWDKINLSYEFENYTGDLDDTKVKKAIRIAFKQWSSASRLTFTPARSGQGDIKINFSNGEHGDGNSFDGISGVLAHAFFPGSGRDGQVHFDEAELWTDDNPASGTDLATVALHEFGHTFGLSHSLNRQAIMYAYYGGVSRKLLKDDVDGIQSIYGKPKRR